MIINRLRPPKDHIIAATSNKNIIDSKTEVGIIIRTILINLIHHNLTDKIIISNVMEEDKSSKTIQTTKIKAQTILAGPKAAVATHPEEAPLVPTITLTLITIEDITTMIVTTKDHNITTSNIKDHKINLKLARNTKEEAHIPIITIVPTTSNITIGKLIIKAIK